MKKNHHREYISEETVEHGHGHGSRPRNLGVLEAVVHLDADWGTSLAYILPLALSLAGRLAPIYMFIIAGIMFIVASGYKIVCRNHPDGGGVYSSLKEVNRFLAVVGALLLVTDYVVTEALSVSDSFHYLHIDSLVSSPMLHWLSAVLAHSSASIWTIIILLVLTAMNWRGPHFSAKFAAFASGSTFILAGILAVLALPLVPAGLANIGHFNQSIFDVLRNTTGVLLALSGVEAISNMTGIMKNPARTSKRALNIELVKVIFTTVILGIAMNALPVNVVYKGNAAAKGFEVEQEHHQVIDFPCVAQTVKAKLMGSEFTCAQQTTSVGREDMLVAMGEYIVPGTLGKIYGSALGFAYGLLLIFAGNTALIDITNVTYALAKDGELPKIYKKLNKKHGVPIAGLFTAAIMPIATILIVGSSIEALAALYAIGVVGAVTMNLAGTALRSTGWDRIVSAVGASVMAVLFATLAYTKMEATIFATSVVCLGLIARAIQKRLSQPHDDTEDTSSNFSRQVQPGYVTVDERK